MGDDFVSAIIPAAGKGTRMDVSINKQYIKLERKAILTHTISVFDKLKDIDEIIIVVAENEEDLFKEKILKKYKIKKPYKIVTGGKTRQESVYNAILELDEKSTIVAIHDGARPLVTKREILATVKSAKEHGASVLGVPMKETMKRVNKDGFIEDTVKRDYLYRILTPQTFKTEIIKKAHENAIKYGVEGTDDAYLVEKDGVKVRIVKGSYNNIKITTPEDLIYAQQFLSYRK